MIKVQLGLGTAVFTDGVALPAAAAAALCICALSRSVSGGLPAAFADDTQTDNRPTETAVQRNSFERGMIPSLLL
jgi:hypothetical protein